MRQDDAPSCKKELASFDEAMDEFKSFGATVVGVRNAAGDKGADEDYPSMKIVVDDGDAVRTEIGIEKDLFGLLGGHGARVNWWRQHPVWPRPAFSRFSSGLPQAFRI